MAQDLRALVIVKVATVLVLQVSLDVRRSVDARSVRRLGLKAPIRMRLKLLRRMKSLRRLQKRLQLKKQPA